MIVDRIHTATTTSFLFHTSVRSRLVVRTRGEVDDDPVADDCRDDALPMMFPSFADCPRSH